MNYPMSVDDAIEQGRGFRSGCWGNVLAREVERLRVQLRSNVRRASAPPVTIEEAMQAPAVPNGVRFPLQLEVHRLRDQLELAKLERDEARDALAELKTSRVLPDITFNIGAAADAYERGFVAGGNSQVMDYTKGRNDGIRECIRALSKL
jgi:hypothetical protein